MNKKVLSILLFLVLCNLIAFGFLFKKDNDLKVVFFDIGQGDSIFIETKDGHQILVDGGEDSSVLENLEEYMNPLDKDLDMVILTHPDKDHLGGLIPVLKTYNINSFVWTGAESDSDLYLELEELLQNEKVVIVDAHDKISVGDIVLEVYNPVQDVKEVRDLNDTSIVFKLIHEDSKFLLTGDLTSVFENNLIQNFDLKSNVLKVGHHGSKYSTSEDFLKAVSPDCAVISVGENNYGHPDEGVMDLLENNGVRVLRTDVNGDIVFYSNSEGLFIENKLWQSFFKEL